MTLSLQQTDHHGYRATDVLQSQLFILKVLAICMAVRYNASPEDARSEPSNGVQSGSQSVPDSPAASVGSAQAKRLKQSSLEKMSIMAPSPLLESPALDDNCARYILSVMILFLRQTAPPHQRLMSAANINFNASYHDFESVEAAEAPGVFDFYPELPRVSSKPKAMFEFKQSHSSLRSNETPSVSSSSINPMYATAYEKTSSVVANSMLSLNSLIAQFSGRIVYHLSASNWPVVFARIRNKIYILAGTTEDDPDIIDLQLLTYCTLDRVRLLQSLQGSVSLIPSILTRTY